MKDYLIYIGDYANAEHPSAQVIKKGNAAVYVIRSLYHPPQLPSGHQLIGYDHLDNSDYEFINDGMALLESVYSREPQTITDDEGNEQVITPPLKPYRMGPLDTQSLATVASKRKLEGMAFAGKQVSLTEANQNGIAAVLKACELAQKHGANITPFNFKADSKNGESVITFESTAEFEMFALLFLQARQAFFSR